MLVIESRMCLHSRNRLSKHRIGYEAGHNKCISSVFIADFFHLLLFAITSIECFLLVKHQKILQSSVRLYCGAYIASYIVV